jgi:hypothetical protein
MSKRITDVPEATRIDSQDQILFLQASTKKTKRISRDNFASSPGFSETVITSEGGDTTPPAVPTGLAVTTTSEIMADGTERIIIRAKINPNTEQDLASYAWYIRRASGTPTFDGGGVLTGYSVAQVFSEVVDLMPAEGSTGADGKVTKEWIVVANSYYEVRVRAIDIDDNSSPYTELNNTNVILSSKDSTAPSAPTNASATSAIRSAFVTWVNPSDKDLAYVKLYRPISASGVRSISAATRSGVTVTITTSSAHGFSSGNSVTVVGLSGTLNPNGEKTVTVLSPTQFAYSIGTGTGSETYTRTNAITTLTSNISSVFDGYADAFTDTTTVQGETYYYWLTAVDYSGNVSTFPSNVATTTPGTVQQTDVADFAINATKMYNNTIVLEGDSWTSNLVTYTVSWNSHFLYYRGVKYTVASGSVTASSEIAGQRVAYVYATIPVSGSSITYNTFIVTGTTSPNDYPVLTDSMFMIATNVNGAYDLAWNAIANAVIGSAYIKNAAIDSAKIREVIADRISTGTIDAKTLTITGGGVIKSAGVTNFTTGQGFYLEGTTLGTTSRFGVGDLSGSGSFVKFDVNTLTVQGEIRATSGYIGGTAAGWAITSNKITSGTVTLDASAGAQKIFIGTGTYNNTNTSFYTDSSGNFSLGSSLTFASNVLTVNGAVNATSGYFGSASSAVSINSTGLTIGTTGRINGNIDYNASFSPPFNGPGDARGFFLGYAGSAYRFFIGHGGSSPTAYMYWDGTSLSINGSVLSSATTSGAYGLTVGSTYGIRYVNDTSVLTISGSNSNGEATGAQIDLVGNSYASTNKGALVLAAGNATATANGDAAIHFRVNGTLAGLWSKLSGYLEVYSGLSVQGLLVTSGAGRVGGWVADSGRLYSGNLELDATNTRIQAGPSASNYVRMSPSGIVGVNSTLGTVFNLPTDGSAPTFSSGIINTTIFNVSTQGVIRTSTTVGDGTVNGAGVLINNTGVKGFKASSATPVFHLDATDGKITANEGLIAGWTINPAYLAKDTGVASTSSGMAPTDYPFYAGATYSGRASAPFRVTPAGAITASSGTIGGWALGSTTLTSGSLSIDSATSGRINAVLSYDTTYVKNISSASRSTTTVTINTSTAHGFSNNDLVTVVGLSGTVNANGTRTITVTSSTQFTYSLTSGTGSETYTLSSATAGLAPSFNGAVGSDSRGFFLGSAGGFYRFFIGEGMRVVGGLPVPGSSYMYWDGYQLNVKGGIVSGDTRIDGRLGSTIAGAIDSNGELTTTNLNTSTKSILKDFSFSAVNYQGALVAGTGLTWSTSTGLITGGSGVVVNARGILGASAGSPTFTLDAITGDATFSGTVTAADGSIGGWTISPSELSGGNVVINSSGIIRSAGATLFNSGTGFWMGYDSGVAKFRVGAPGGQQISFDGTNLNLDGNTLSIVNSIVNTDTAASRSWQGNVAANKGIYIQRKDGTATTLAMLSYGSSCIIRGEAYGGTTYGSPTATQSGIGMQISVTGYTGSSYGAISTIELRTLENWSGSTAGSYIDFVSRASGASLASSDRIRMIGTKIEFGDIFSRDTNLYRSAANSLVTDDNFQALSFNTTYFQAGVTTAVDVKDVNLRIFQGATQRARIDYTTGDYYIQFNKIIGTRKTGWTAPTGTATRTSFDTSTVTTQQLAERVKAMLDDLIGHGLLGA